MVEAAAGAEGVVGGAGCEGEARPALLRSLPRSTASRMRSAALAPASAAMRAWLRCCADVSWWGLLLAAWVPKALVCVCMLGVDSGAEFELVAMGRACGSTACLCGWLGRGGTRGGPGVLRMLWGPAGCMHPRMCWRRPNCRPGDGGGTHREIRLNPGCTTGGSQNWGAMRCAGSGVTW